MKFKLILMPLFVFSCLLFVACSGTGTKVEKVVVEVVTKVEVINKPIKITKAEFLEKVANYEVNPTEWKYLGDKPAIVDFYADWCGPCRIISPILEELALEYGDSIQIYKVDTDVEKELAMAFGIKSLPSLLFIPMQGEPQMIMGARPKGAFKKMIDEVLLQK